MDKIEIYDKIKEKYEELKSEYDSLKGEIVDFKESDDQKSYDSIDDEIVKQTMFPKEYEIYKKIDEVEEKIEHFYGELYNKAKEIYIELNGKVSSFESKIKTNEEYIEKLEEQAKELDNQYKELINSEEYKAGDEEALLKADDLKDQIKQKNNTISKFKKNIEKYKEDIEKSKKIMEEIDKEYNFEEELLGKETSDTERTENEDTPSESEDKDTKDKNDKEDITENNKGSKTKGGVGYGVPVLDDKDKSIEEDDKDKQEEGKEQLDDLLNKAKKNELKEEDYDKIATILGDPSKYEEYGITTGFFSNKGKTLLLALSKNTQSSFFKDRKDIKSLIAGTKFNKEDQSKVIATAKLKNWNGLKELVNDPEKEINGENNLKEIVKNLEEVEEPTEEQKKALEKAKKGIARFAALRNASKGYADVVNERQKNNRFLVWFNSLNVKKLDTAKGNEEQVETTPVESIAEEPKEKNELEGLSGKTYPPRKEDLDTPTVDVDTSKDDIVK